MFSCSRCCNEIIRSVPDLLVGPENLPVRLDYKFVIPDNRISERCPQREKLNTGKSPGKRYRMTRVNIGRCLSATLFLHSSKSIPKLRTKRHAVTLDGVFFSETNSVTQDTSEERAGGGGDGCQRETKDEENRIAIIIRSD